VPDPGELLAAARGLLIAGHPAPPTDAQIRRALSTAYDALFHSVLAAAATRFMGADAQASAGYAILYRGFQHSEMKRICEEIDKSFLNRTYRECLKVHAVSRDMRDFAKGFTDLQVRRHAADYDPTSKFSASDVASSIDAAELAIASFERTTKQKQADVLALLLVGARK